MGVKGEDEGREKEVKFFFNRVIWKMVREWEGLIKWGLVGENVFIKGSELF